MHYSFTVWLFGHLTPFFPSPWFRFDVLFCYVYVAPCCCGVVAHLCYNYYTENRPAERYTDRTNKKVIGFDGTGRDEFEPIARVIEDNDSDCDRRIKEAWRV